MTRYVDDEVKPSSPGVNWLTALASSQRKTKAQELVVTGMAAMSAYRQAREWWTGRTNEREYIVSIPDTDDVYWSAQMWVIDQLHEDHRRSLRATTRRVRPDQVTYDDDDDNVEVVYLPNGVAKPVRRVFLSYDGSKAQDVTIDGFTVTVHVDDPEVPRLGGENNSRALGKPGAIVFQCHSPEAQRAVLNLIEKLAADLDVESSQQYRVYIATKWGRWDQLGGRTPRPMDTVVLRGDQREELSKDLEWFLKQEHRYAKMGVPWHRGYLLEGPPGTGKTSMAQALAGEFDMEVYYVPLADLTADTDLANLVSNVEARSMLLLEDIDVVTGAKREARHEDKKDAVSLTGLLNALDGIITPHGLITVMTTNDASAMDDALLRPGRADRRYVIGYADGDQVRRLVNSLVGIDVGPLELDPVHEVSPAEVVEVLKSTLELDSIEVVDAVRMFVTDRTK